CERRHQFDLLFRKWLDLSSANDDHSNECVLPEHGNTQHRPLTTEPMRFTRVFGICEGIGDVDHLAFKRDPPYGGPAPRSNRVLLNKILPLLGYVVRDRQAKYIFILP